MDAGISSMTGYCDIDSLLSAACDHTCTAQPERFQSFAIQNSSSEVAISMSSKSSVLDVKSTPVEDIITRTTMTAKTRRCGKTTHEEVEQRYRHNLVLQFHKLASTVPSIETAQPACSGQLVKFKKAGILISAAAYIQQLEKENAKLRSAMSQAHECLTITIGMSFHL